MLEDQHSEQTKQQGAELLPADPDKAHLKPERVQQLLLKLPGWRLGAEGGSIARRRHFTSFAEAQAFVGRVGKLATALRQPVTIALSGKRVNLTLAGHPIKGRTGGLTNDVFNLAGRIG
jgi:pterin-4a-carbinolamine dehydratase